MPPWPDGFARIPEADWTDRSIADLAKGYDTVEQHGWYANLDPTVEEVARILEDGRVWVDYSGGTGILVDRVLDAAPDVDFGAVLVDSSPKFLRLALEKLAGEPRVAFRRIDYLEDEERLQYVDEVLGPLSDERVDLLSSTNAIHLYHDLAGTLRAWRRVLRPGGHVHVQSGNIDRDDRPKDRWIIDRTVDVIHDAAVEIVRSDDRFSAYRDVLDDGGTMQAHGDLRRKYFLPVRPLDHYTDALSDAGLEVRHVAHRPVRARVEEWRRFLAVYHDGILGWVGGSPRVEGSEPSEADVEARLELLAGAMGRVFGDREVFEAEWTYVTCRKPR